ncbi:MAG: hypothetical protein EOO89_03055 [Pedobacter sp.]|nr:MAG: hypothetical protein EOO89_03055 [Pedobacter sp.]
MKEIIAARTLKPAIKSTSPTGDVCPLCLLLKSNNTAAVKQMAETMFSGVNFTFKISPITS